MDILEIYKAYSVAHNQLLDTAVTSQANNDIFMPNEWIACKDSQLHLHYRCVPSGDCHPLLSVAGLYLPREEECGRANEVSADPPAGWAEPDG